jgi:hypothetical protein
LHHAGLPLAIFVLLQDYRFLLLDAFLRFVLNASLAAAALLISIRVVQSPELVSHIRHPFDAGLLFLLACLLLTAFVYARNRMQGLLTRVLSSYVQISTEHCRNFGISRELRPTKPSTCTPLRRWSLAFYMRRGPRSAGVALSKLDRHQFPSQ